MVGAADAAKKRAIPGRDGVVDIEVLLRGIANNLNQLGLISLCR